MKKLLIKNILVLVLIIISLPAFSQVKDAQLWNSIEIEKKINKKFTLNLVEEIRFAENISLLDQHFTEIGLEYKLNKHLFFAGGYRFSQKHDIENVYKIRNRWFVEASYKFKFKDLSFVLKSNFHSQYSQYYSSATGKVPENYSQNKLTVKYILNRRFKPYTSVDCYFPLNDSDLKGIDEIRLVLGNEYSIYKHLILNTFYQIQQEFDVKNPETNFVIGLGLKYEF